MDLTASPATGGTASTVGGIEVIFNLTQHDPTPEQVAAGVSLRDAYVAAEIRALLTVPSAELRGADADALLTKRAVRLAQIADASTGYEGRVMIGGQLELTPIVARCLRLRGLIPVYSVSDRVSRDVVQPDGAVKKVSEFAHLFFKEYKA